MSAGGEEASEAVVVEIAEARGGSAGGFDDAVDRFRGPSGCDWCRSTPGSLSSMVWLWRKPGGLTNDPLLRRSSRIPGDVKNVEELACDC